MKVLSLAECQDWSERHTGRLFPRDMLCEPYGSRNRQWRIPTDASKKTVLARTLASCWTGGLLWITDWGIFPSGENMHLFDAVRASLGVTESLYEAPGHLLGPEERITMECMYDLCLYFYWDAAALDQSGVVVRISHDEHVTLAGDPEMVQPYDIGIRRALEHRLIDESSGLRT